MLYYPPYLQNRSRCPQKGVMSENYNSFLARSLKKKINKVDSFKQELALILLKKQSFLWINSFDYLKSIVKLVRRMYKTAM